MKKLVKIVASLGVMLIVGVAGTMAYNHYRAKTLNIHVSQACKPRQQLITRQYRDWLIMQSPGADCRYNDPQIVYTNGETGVRHSRDNGTLESETVWSANGDVRKQVKYADNGKTIVEATENWLDGKPAWQLSVGKDGATTSTRYWPNGKIFSQEKTPRSSGQTDITWYYESGQQRAHFVGTFPRYGGGIVSGAKVLDTWSENGAALMHMEMVGGSPEFTVHRADGTLWYVLSEQGRSWYGNTPSTIEEYAADGKTKYRHMTLYGGYSPFYVTKAIQYLPDGTTWEYNYKSYSWDFSLVQHWDKDHQTMIEWKPTDPNFTIDKHIVTEPKFFDPSDQWTKLVDKLIYQTSAP
ncbi:MAG TPA: hypothetical protein V6D22_17215 [Candidatus Obscuribacterales bacterium]